MSTSLLYHAFGVRDYQYLKSNFVEGQVVFTIEKKPETLRCAACGSAEVIVWLGRFTPCRSAPGR